MSFKNNISVKMELDFHSQDVNKRFCKINASKKNLIWNIQKKKTYIN